ncbi:MAG: hypothetical protein FWF92_11715 [Oscillospiraceae bacterium]|nr:hypothetical protein [Oscillospiraceae bacterium]
MKKLKIVIAILLCLVFVLPLFIACGKEESKTDDKTTTINDNSGDSSDIAKEEEKDPDSPDLPAAVDMGEKTFTVFTAGWGEGSELAKDIGGEEQTGDPIDDAAYNRRIKLEQMYNCKIRQVNEGDNTEAMNKYQTSILSGDGSYDFAVTNCTNFASLLTGSYLMDFKELSYIDMDKPYWDKNFYDSMAILGRHFAASGDISKRRLECVWIMCFNKAMIDANNFESPYDLVKNGQWTFDKMVEMAKQVAQDLDGNGKMTETDLYGLNYTGDTIMGIINCSGVKIAELNEDGVPELTIGIEKNLEKLIKIYETTRDDTFSIDTLFRFWLNDTFIFSENRCLFLACATHNIGNANGEVTLRSMDVNFGIIPYPKWDLAQDNYTPHTAGNYHPVLSVPKTNVDLENTGILLEAMSYEGMKTIKPAFYESLLKTKTARDDESAEMIDYIFGNLNYDIGNMYNFGEIVGKFGYGMSANDNKRVNIVSTIDKNVNVWQKAIDDIVAAIENSD